MTLLSHLGLAASAAAWLLASCSPTSSNQNQSGRNRTADAAPTGTATGTTAATATQASTGTATAGQNATATADSWPTGIYTGYDGVNSFDVLLPGFGNYKVADPSIATITASTFTITQDLHDSLWAACQKINANAVQANFDRLFATGKVRNVYTLKPLKPGRTYLTIAQSTTNGGRANPFGGRNGQPLVLEVNSYPAGAVATGKSRYNDAPAVPGATNPPCASCHLTGKNGAPSHALGQVEQLPDVAVRKWIETGKLPFINLDAQTDHGIAHAWTFDTPDQELGIIAYLRTLQSTNFEELLTLEFQSDTQASAICNLTQTLGVGPPGGASAAGNGTAAATGTATAR